MFVATEFLKRFRSAERAGDPMVALLEDPVGFGAAVDLSPEELDDALAQAVEGDFGAPAILNREGFASAACDRDGAVIHAGPRFKDWFREADLFSATLAELAADRPNVSLLTHDRTGRPVAVAAGLASMALNWPLDSGVRAALEGTPDGYAVVAFQPSGYSWERVREAYGLTAAEGLLVAALARHGDLQRAARERGIAYETARKFVAAAMRKTGARRQTELIRQALNVAAGEVAVPAQFTPVLRDLFDLSQEQAELSILLSQGMTRDGAGTQLGLSANQAKAALKSIFENCGVSSAVDLARIVSEVSALEGLATACHVELRSTGEATEPLRLIPRRRGEGAIAVVDYGPPGARPVLIFHGGSSGRTQVRGFVSALQAVGRRPISVERAGFGLSSFVPGDPVVTAVRDISDVLDALGLKSASAIALSTFAAVVACAAQNAGRVTGGVIINPDPATVSDPTIGHRLLNAMKMLIGNHPDLGARFIRLIYRRATPASIERSFRSTAKGSPSDEALFDDPACLVDFERGARQAAVGERGVINEMRALIHGPQPDPVPDPGVWTILFGAQDPTLNVTDARAHWLCKLPSARVEIIADGGHWLHASHSSAVAAAFVRQASRPQNATTHQDWNAGKRG